MGIKQNARRVMVGPGLTLVHAALVRIRAANEPSAKFSQHYHKGCAALRIYANCPL